MKKRNYVSFLQGLIKHHIGLIILNLMIQIILFSYNSIPAFYTRKILNEIETSNAGGKVSSSIMICLLAIIVFAVIRVLFIFIEGISTNIQNHLNESLVKLNLLKLIEKVPNLKNIAGNSSKVFDTIRNDTVNSIRPIGELLEVIGYTAYSAIAIFTLFAINYKVTLFIFLPLSLVVFVVNKVTDRIKSYRKQNREIGAKISEAISDISDSVLTIKVNNAQQSVVRNFDKFNKTRFHASIKDIMFNETVSAFTGGTIYIGTAIMMIMVAKEMLEGRFLVGDFSIFIYYLGTLASLINRIVDLIALTKQGEVSYSRIVDMVGEEQAKCITEDTAVYMNKEVPEYIYPKLEKVRLKEFKVENLSYQHDSNIGAISKVSFTVKPGEILVITGNVGSGKSTLLNVLLGILPKEEGTIYWNDNVIHNRSEMMRPPNVAYTAQSIGLFSGTIRENITFGKSVSNVQIEEALIQAVFKQDVDQMVNGLDTEIGDRGDMLSGGQKQRLALARMFINKAELYIMDDCTSAIDVKTEKELWRQVKQNIQSKSFACIIASNKEYVLQQADKILVLEDGKVIDYISKDKRMPWSVDLS